MQVHVAVFAMLITLLFARPCWPETCLFGKGCTFCCVVLPLQVPSFAPICGGLHGRSEVTQSPTMEEEEEEIHSVHTASKGL